MLFKENSQEIVHLSLYLAANFKHYFPLGENSGFSAGLGIYGLAGNYRNEGAVLISCRAGFVIIIERDIETSIGHFGLTVPLRFHQKFGKDNRWLLQVGGELMIPIIKSANYFIYNCDDTPGISSEFDAGFRHLIPQLTVSLGYGVSTGNSKREGLYIGPFFSYTPISHFMEESRYLPDDISYSMGIRVSGFRVRR